MEASCFLVLDTYTRLYRLIFIFENQKYYNVLSKDIVKNILYEPKNSYPFIHVF